MKVEVSQEGNNIVRLIRKIQAFRFDGVDRKYNNGLLEYKLMYNI